MWMWMVDVDMGQTVTWWARSLVRLTNMTISNQNLQEPSLGVCVCG